MGIEALVLGMGETMQKMAYSQDRMEVRIKDLEEALTNQEHTIREQEKDIVTLKLQEQSLRGLIADLQRRSVSDPVPTVSEPVSEYSRYDPAWGY